MTTKTILLILAMLFFSHIYGQKNSIYKSQTIHSFRNAIDPGKFRTIIQQTGNDTDAGEMPETDIKQLYEFLKKAPFVWKGNTAKADNLVSNYTFRKLIRKNFNNLILGNDEVSKIGRYATLDIADNNSFSFSPLTLESNPRNSNYQNILSLQFSGKLNDENIFKTSNFRNLSAGLTLTHILGWSNFKTVSRNFDSIQSAYKNCSLNEPLDELYEKYKKIKEQTLCKTDKKESTLFDEFVEEYSDLEATLTEPLWKSLNFWWIQAEINFWGSDQFSFLPASLLSQNNYTPTDKTIFTPGLSAALNYFSKNKKTGHSFLLSMWTALKRKHSLSEIYEPESFQQTTAITNSVAQLGATDDVFITDFSTIKTGWVSDFGFRSVGMLDISSPDRSRQIGLSLSFQRKGMVSDGAFPSLFRTETGLVIPFLKSDNESTFNLEIFRRWDNFSNFPAENNRFWGIRFNVPINNN